MLEMFSGYSHSIMLMLTLPAAGIRHDIKHADHKQKYARYEGFW